MDRTERQKEGIRKWISFKCKGTWMYSTGFGKTYATIMAIKGFLSKNFNKNIVVIVPSDYLKIQWMQELFKNNLLEKVSVEIINSAIKKTEKVDLIILDEHLSSLNPSNCGNPLKLI